MRTKKILTADIGGTNSRFGYFETDGEERLALVQSKWFRTGDVKSFTHLIARLMKVISRSSLLTLI